MRRAALVGVILLGVLGTLGVSASAPDAAPRVLPRATPPPAGTTPTRALCPASISVQFTDSFGNPRGQPVQVSVARFVKRVDYEYLCQYERPGAPQEGEYYVVIITHTPPGVPGRIPAGDCARTNPNPLSSEKRYLLISGGPRKSASFGVPNDLTVLTGALRAAEAAGVGRACPGTSPPPPPRPPPPPPVRANALGIEYSMPSRYPNERGVVDSHRTKAEIAPAFWLVNIDLRRKDGKPCKSTDLASVTANGEVLTPKRLKRLGPCRLQARLRKEGTYGMAVRLKTAGGVLAGERTIVVQDWLIVGLGDSNGSGEGVPDVPINYPRRERWQSRQCHRSVNSYQAIAARRIEFRDPRTSVTFVHLSCSGATIGEGLLGAYAGIEPADGRPLRPQVPEAKRLAFGREIDAVLISIGVNDLRFGAMVGHCIKYTVCDQRRFPASDSPTTLAQRMALMLFDLPGLFERLSRSLSQIGVQPSRVYVNEYFDSTRDGNGRICNPLIITPLGVFDGDEAEWAYRNVLVPLNDAVEAAATRHTWGYIRGPEARFREHGYCAREKSWIVKLTGSFIAQLNKEGTLHATKKGNEASAGFAVSRVRRDFYAGNRTRPPAG